MNIYLTSYGLDTRYGNYINGYDEVITLLRGKKVAIIVNAKLKNEDRSSSVIAKDELNKNGIIADIVDLDDKLFDIDDYDALYLCGGEPKYLMDSIYEAALFDDIKRFIDNNGVVIGQSAGAMIFNKEYLDTSCGELLIRENGFNYGDKIIVPHYDNLSDDLLKVIPRDILVINDCDKLIRLS